MNMVVDFLVNNYMWFLVTTIILIFALIGYLVEAKEYKKASVYGVASAQIEHNFEALAESAQNKTLNDAMMMQSVGTNNQVYMNGQVPNNMMTPNGNQNAVNMSMGANLNSQGNTFQTLGK